MLESLIIAYANSALRNCAPEFTRLCLPLLTLSAVRRFSNRDEYASSGVTGRQSERQAVPYQILPPCIMHRATLPSQRGNFPDTERQEHTRRSSTSLFPILLFRTLLLDFGVRCVLSGPLLSLTTRQPRTVVFNCRNLYRRVGSRPSCIQISCEKLRVIFRPRGTYTAHIHVHLT